ncbi:hypothetical protein ACEWY4_000604 [Coilia grayii]|uniref:Uncharacterized protein n=1 Tax=Coilia grayii TaxID=363190 RepID=A0ABD1KX43_9TELE
MSVDTLGHSPRRMVKAPPPPVPPKRFQVKDALQDLAVRPSVTPEERKPSAAERLAADRGRFIKSQPIVLSRTPPMTAVPVSRKQLAPPSSPSSASQPKISPLRPTRKTAPPTARHSGAPLLDLKHLTSLISGVGETASGPASQATGASSPSSLSSDGVGGDENCAEPVVAVTLDPSPSDKMPAPPLCASPAQLSPSSPSPSPSPSLDSPWRAGVGADACAPQGCPAVAVRRVDVRPQMAPLRKAMRGPLQGRMPAQVMQMPMAAHAKLQQQAQSQAHLMYLLKAQMASKNAPVLPRNTPLMPTAKLPPSPAQGMPGVAAQRVLVSASQPCLPPQQSSNVNSPIKSPTVPNPPQPGSATPQSSTATSTTTPPLRTTSPTAGKPAESQTPTAPTQPLSSPWGVCGGSNSPVPAPSPSPSITRLSSTSSRKRPSLTRSKSDVSDRFSRAGADLERFFNYCGLDPADLDDLTQHGSDIASVSRLRSASAPASECSQAQEREEGEEEEDEAAPQVQRTAYGISVIERNARVIKWLYGLRQARDPVRASNI